MPPTRKNNTTKSSICNSSSSRKEQSEIKNQEERRTKKRELSSHHGSQQQQQQQQHRQVSSSKRTKRSLFLKGIIVAVSILQEENSNTGTTIIGGESKRKIAAGGDEEEQEATEWSYKSVAERCRQAGAHVSNQVHKRLTCVLCTKNAVTQTTQRVRKAIKMNIPLVDVAWLDECYKECKRVDLEPFRVKYSDGGGQACLLVKYLDGDQNKMDNRNEALNPNCDEKYRNEEDGEDTSNRIVSDPDAGWSNAIPLGCCCVCHEEKWETCEWCGDHCGG